MAKVQMAEPDSAHGRGAAGPVALAAGEGAGSPSAAAGESQGPALAVQAERRSVDPARAGCTGGPTGGTRVIERPILFSGAMVRAILDGRKTQTRRVVKPQPEIVSLGIVWTHPKKLGAYVGEREMVPCPYGQPGDRLWVKETHARLHDGMLSHLDPDPDSPYWFYVYRADGEPANWKHYGEHWKPSIFCTRKASRITLEIVSVRVERVQEISEKDAIAEGLAKVGRCKLATWLPLYSVNPQANPEKHYETPNDGTYDMPKMCYSDLWDSINGKRKEGKPDHSWAANPWVWVVEFRRVETEGAR